MSRKSCRKTSAREALAPILDVNPDQLKNGRISQVIAHPLARRPVVQAQPGDKVPVMGIAEGGPEGYSLWNGEVVAYVDRPPSLLDTPRGYAVYAVGSSMEPRYYAGETLYINPIKPPKPSDFVLIQLKPKSEGDQPPALIKRLVRRTATKLVVEQYNPAKTYDIPIADVLEIHKIVGSGE
jgi:phage repressor protein C with HTH and peptisase S24 domain